MEGVLIDGGSVHILDDIDLSAAWPFRTNGPEGRPNCGSSGELPEVGDEETSIVTFGAGNANRSPVATRCNITLVVDLHDGGAIWLDIRKVLGIRLRYILNVSVGGVRLIKEGPAIKEVLALVLFMQSISGGPGCVVSP